MLLTINIGNTHIKVGLWNGEHLQHVFRFHTDLHLTEDEYGALLHGMFHCGGLTSIRITGVVLCSVVPALTPIWQDVCRVYLRGFARLGNGVEPLVITGETDTGLTNRYENPALLGADRWVNAFAAHSLFSKDEGDDAGRGCIVVDMGTATTFEAVRASGVYLGGAIAPGVQTALDALVMHGAQLSQVPLIAPTRVIGTNTGDALRSGVLLGTVAQVEGMVTRLRSEMDDPHAVVVATGGLSELVIPLTNVITHHEPNLTLIGLRLLHERLTT